MTLTVELSESTLARFQAEAARRGVGIDVVIAELAETLPPETAGEERKLSFIGLGASTSGRHGRDADDLLADGFGRN
ncbi:MAG TPA: hypothetical protein VH063_11800 [Gaiellaceae bacterium]|jgi:hypothetical protein|nr:hypothetical protein [Gaiellaceae bacterium]